MESIIKFAVEHIYGREHVFKDFKGLISPSVKWK